MTTSQKLWLGFGTLTALMVLSSVAIIVRVRSIEEQVGKMANARNLSAEARQLEINTLGYALNVRAFLQTGEPQARRDAITEAAQVERQLKEYESLATTDRQRDMAGRFAPLWQEFQKLGQSLLLDAENRPANLEDSKKLYVLRTGLEKLLDDEMQVDAMEAYNARSDAVQQDVQTIVGFAVILLIVGVVIAVTMGGTVGRAVVQGEHAVAEQAERLQEAHDTLENRVRERTAELAASTEALGRSNRELEQFASVASHDLQEPLRKIQAFGDRLQAKYADGLGEQGREYVERMQASAARMRNLIDALLTFSRVTTKAQPFVPVDLAATAREVVSDLEGRLQQSGGRVEVGSLPTIDADPSQMRQLLQNLVANALKFHKPAEPPLVRVEARLLNGASGNGRTDLRYEIAVCDNGIGFDEIYLDRIFEVYQRLHSRQEYEGTGVGLAICHKIVERHGGSITAKSAPDQGATFLVTLPVQQSKEEKHHGKIQQADHHPDGGR